MYPGDSAEPEPLAETVLALKWDVVLEGGSASAFDGLARATNWHEFVAAVRQFAAPAQNFVYADIDGNIGYAMSGLVPVRNGSDGSVPVEGWPAEADWHGWVDPAQLPAVLNPPSGQIITANNEIDRRLPFVVTRDWVAPFRAQRIGELLGEHRNLDLRAMQDIQADITSAAADRLLKAIELPDSVKELRTWDRRVDSRPVAMLFEAFEEALWSRTFADEMPQPLYEQFYRYAANERFAGLHAVITEPHSSWFDDRSHARCHRDARCHRRPRGRRCGGRAAQEIWRAVCMAVGRGSRDQVFASAGWWRPPARLVLQPRAVSDRRRRDDRE